MSVRITDLPEATELNGSELMPIVQNGVTRRTTLDFVNQAAPAALILQQTQQVLADTQQVLADTQQVKAETDQVLVNTEGVYNQTVMVQGQVDISIADWETQYLGSHPAPPTTDNEGNPLQKGALYWNTSLNAMFVWDGTSWTAFSSTVASVNGQIGEVVLDYTNVGAAASARTLTAGNGITGGGDLSADRTFTLGTPSTLTTSTTNAVTTTSHTHAVTFPVTSVAGKTGAVALAVGDVSGAAASARTLTAGNGLTGGGDLTADRTLTLGTPDTLTTSTTNAVTATSHTHAVTFPVTSVAGKTGAVVVSKADVGLGNVDNTSDANKPISTATQAALDLKLNANDASVTNAREWTASTVAQAEAEAGTATTRRAWTAERVFQAIAAWWNASAFKTKLDGIQAGAQVNTVNSVAGKIGIVTLVKGDVGLANVDNTSDLAKPLSTAQAVAIADATSFQQAGAGAVVRTAQDKMREWVNVKDFGAVGDGVADDTAAINAAITYAKTLVAPRLIINSGTYLTSGTLTFDLPNYSTMEFLGVIRTATGNPAVRIGSTSTNPFGYTVTGIKVERLTTDTTNGSVGVEIRNVVASYIDIRKVTGFQDGVLCYADQGNGGVSYNEIHIGFLHDNRYNLHLQAVGAGGYVNENVFVGGTFNHSSGYPAVSTINIWIDYATYRNNNNRFICPSLEDSSTLAVAAIINGDNNLILHPRMERSVSQSTYQIQLTSVSSDNQIIGAGFTMIPSNINDAGEGNCYETRQSMTISKQTLANEGLLRLRSTASGLARVWQAEDTEGITTAYARGDGFIYSSTRGYFETGLRWQTGSGTLNDRGLFVGSGSPDGVVSAEPGSLYMNTAGGANTTLWVKESGGGNTGWVAK